MTESNEDRIKNTAEGILINNIDKNGHKIVLSIIKALYAERNRALDEAARVAHRYFVDPYTSDTGIEAENIMKDILALKEKP